MKKQSAVFAQTVYGRMPLNRKARREQAALDRAAVGYEDTVVRNMRKNARAEQGFGVQGGHSKMYRKVCRRPLREVV